MSKWRHVGTKMASKINVNLESPFFIDRALAAAGARFLRFRGSKLEAKVHQKSIKKWSPRWNASRHRFLNDFDWFRVPSWDGKSIKNRFLAARIDTREDQTLPGAPKSSQKLGESIFSRFPYAKGGDPKDQDRTA